MENGDVLICEFIFFKMTIFCAIFHLVLHDHFFQISFKRCRLKLKINHHAFHDLQNPDYVQEQATTGGVL